MRIIVCVKQKADGELNPFDACAYEEALKVQGAQVILLSMAPEKSKEMLLNLTRLGAKEAYLLCDKAFAGADTLATSYTLSQAIKKIGADLVFCGRQTVDGDTAQVGPGVSEFLKFNLISNVLEIKQISDNVVCKTRNLENVAKKLPCVLTIERINDLRKPSLRSKLGTVTVLKAEDIDADISRCGLSGSPTQVIKSFENNSDKRKCQFIQKEEFFDVVQKSLNKEIIKEDSINDGAKLKNVWIMGEKPLEYAKSISDDIKIIEQLSFEEIVNKIKEENPSVILWDSTPYSKEMAARVAVALQTGLCADCTKLETDGQNLFMYRPAFSGNIIAKIKCKTMPQMATVRTGESNQKQIMLAVGKGAKEHITDIYNLAQKLDAQVVASRGAVDSGLMEYPAQIGLTGRCVSPLVYIAFGVSGAVHHIVGMKNSGTVIAVSCDKKAPIFEYADYGIILDINEFFRS